LPEGIVSFVWFWTFWHWSVEGGRAGTLLRGPIHGVASHWDEWFRYEASPAERATIAAIGSSVRGQRQFVVWLVRGWAREARWRREPPHARFVLTQLAQRVPFSEWSALARYRESYAGRGLSAIVLAEGSAGESSDVRRVEAVVLPADADASAPPVLAEGFTAERVDLDAARGGALSLLEGSGLVRLLALWVVCGARPYPGWVGALLLVGWGGVAAGITSLLIGPDPGTLLEPTLAALLLLWVALLAAALATAVVEMRATFRQARRWGSLLRFGQVRLRMNGDLTLIGGSAGLPFALAVLIALSRASPRGEGRGTPRRSWIWERVISCLREANGSLAATGIVRPDGRIEPVVLEPKVVACLRHERVTRLLTPWQRLPDLQDPSGSPAAAAPAPGSRSGQTATPRRNFGYAAEPRSLRRRRCRHLADALMAAGALTDRRQLAINLGAAVVSVVMLTALPDLRNVLAPPPAPSVVAPSSTSPYHLWVSLDTRHPESFQVVFESGFWANRRGSVTEHAGSSGTARAELRLHRLSRPTAASPEDGVVWVERRRSFLARDFGSGERVGRYTFSYVSDRPYD
jgi:hypothetical protein